MSSPLPQPIPPAACGGGSEFVVRIYDANGKLRGGGEGEEHHQSKQTNPPPSPMGGGWGGETPKTNPAALFDLDGTLVNTAPDIHAAASAMLKELSLPSLPFAEARQFIGDGITRFVKRALTRQWWGEPTPELLSRAEESMRRHYARECVARLLCYDGVPETLRALKESGLPMACVTNKPARFSQPLLAACGLNEYFAAVVSGDTLPVKKPNPEPLLAAITTLGADPGQTWMIGDSAADAKAASAAGCRFAVVAYGYHRAGQLPPADAVLQTFPETLPLLAPQTPAEEKQKKQKQKTPQAAPQTV